MAFKINAEHYESIIIKITKDKYPIIFNSKVEELVNQKAFNSREEAETFVEGLEIELVLYYEKDYGLFGVESDAVESRYDIISPYSGEMGEYESTRF